MEKKNKIIAVLFNNGHNEIQEYIEYYYSLKKIFDKENLNLYAIFTDQYDYQTKKFNVYKIMSDDIVLINDSENINIDLILYRSTQINYTIVDIEENYKVINSSKFNMLASSKIQTNKVLKKYSIRTHSLKGIKRNKKKLNKFKGNYIILKPKNGHGGEGIEKIKLEDLKTNFNKIYKQKTNYLAQEFIDMSDGIEGITEGSHDLRFHLYGNKLDDILLRVPKKGDFRANMSAGGTGSFVDIKKIPDEIINKVQEIANHLIKEFGPLFCSIDLANDINKGIVLVELNTTPGITPPITKSFYENIAKFVKNIVS